MKSVIVLGVRSGTSVVAGMLTILGVSMGDMLRGPNKYNAKGYFEDDHFLDLVNRIHQARSGSKMLPVVLRDTDVLPKELEEEFKHLVESHSKELWGFKAPAACYLLSLVERYVKDPYYIVCNRDPIEIASSCMRVEEHILPAWFDWYTYAKDFMGTCLRETEGKRRLVVDFDDIMDSPSKVVRGIVDYLGIDASEESVLTAASFVDPSLRHNKNGL